MDINRPTETVRPGGSVQGGKPTNTWTPLPVGKPRLQPGNPSRGGAGEGTEAGGLEVESRPLPVADANALGGSGKITAFGKGKRHEDSWIRTPNTTGSGAIHVKTFHCKLTEDALAYMDQAINEWLDAHPQYEVKFVSSTIGILTGKLKEPALFCQVWV